MRSPMTKLDKTIQNLEKSVEKIQSRSNSWEAIVEIKRQEKIEDLAPLIAGAKDSFWLLRWTCIEKLGSLKKPEAVNILLNLLNDHDQTVKDAVPKAIFSCIENDIRPLLLRCCDEDDGPQARLVDDALVRRGLLEECSTIYKKHIKQK